MTSILFCTIFTCKDNSAFKLNKAYYYLICKVDYGYNNKKTYRYNEKYILLELYRH
jgi:hypothetical protein